MRACASAAPGTRATVPRGQRRERVHALACLNARARDVLARSAPSLSFSLLPLPLLCALSPPCSLALLLFCSFALSLSLSLAFLLTCNLCLTLFYYPALKLFNPL